MCLLLGAFPSQSEAQSALRMTGPTVEIGSLDGDEEYLFEAIVAIVPLTNGDVVVAEPTELRVFTAQGQHVRTIGRAGSGPGEFRRIHSVHLKEPDTLIVWDSPARRLTRITTGGTVVESRPISLKPLADEGFAFESSWLLPNGHLFVELYTDVPTPSPGTLFRDPVEYATYDPETHQLRRLGLFPGAPRYISSIGIPVVQPLGPTSEWTASGHVIAAGDAEQPAVFVFRQDQTDTIWLTGGGAPLSEADVRHAGERMLQGSANPALLRSLWGETPKPRRYPYFDALVLSRDGRLLVAHPPAGDQSVWTLYDRDGRLATRIQANVNLRPIQLTGERIWAIRTDEYDVQYVVAYFLPGQSAR